MTNLAYAHKLTVTEFPVYGSSRLGEKQANKLVYHTSFTISGVDGEGTLLPDSVLLSETELIDQAPETKRTLGKKLYELTNHLGNVLATIFDRRVHSIVSSDTLWDGDIATAQDYYPFGMAIPDRNYVVDGVGYRYGFNGMERDDEMKGSGNSYDFGARIYDSRLASWLSVDPLFIKYTSISPYAVMGNNAILNRELDGKEWVNAYDEEVRQLNQQLLNNPDNKKLQRDLKKVLINQEIINNIITDLKTYDVDLYNYIENLAVTDLVTGNTINVKVTVGIGDWSTRSSALNHARTSFAWATQGGKGKIRPVRYACLEGTSSDNGPAPIDANNEIGFNIEIYSIGSFSDEYLANEAGDVMYRMEYPKASFKAGSDVDKAYDDYMEKNSPGDYSKDVEILYQERKKEFKATGNPPSTNPYPLKM